MPVLKDLLSRKQPFVAFQTMARHKEGHSIYVQASGIPYFDEAGNILGYRGSCQDITEQKNMMNALKERERELVAKSQTLEEVNAALKVLLKQREEDRKELEGKFVSNIKEMILPYILKMQKGQRDPRVKAYLDIVTANLNEIISPFLNTIRQLNLTPREIEVASFIREGRTTKEIAQILGVATSAVDSHRNNMRIKLGLNKKKINLRSYLLSHK
jgi:DNA-binding CsgD family transcriptional regulator